MGRTGRYKDWLQKEKLLLLQGWARDGLNDEQLAHNIGINVSTLYEWKNKYHEIDEAIKKGKEVVDREVENALLKSALGYEYTEVQAEEIEELDSEGNLTGKKKIYKKKTKKYMAPNVTAQIFWLKNRKSETWRDKVDKDINLEVEDLTPLAEMIRIEETDD